MWSQMYMQIFKKATDSTDASAAPVFPRFESWAYAYNTRSSWNRIGAETETETEGSAGKHAKNLIFQ